MHVHFTSTYVMQRSNSKALTFRLPPEFKDTFHDLRTERPELLRDLIAFGRVMGGNQNLTLIQKQVKKVETPLALWISVRIRATEGDIWSMLTPAFRGVYLMECYQLSQEMPAATHKEQLNQENSHKSKRAEKEVVADKYTPTEDEAIPQREKVECEPPQKAVQKPLLKTTESPTQNSKTDQMKSEEKVASAELKPEMEPNDSDSLFKNMFYNGG